MRSPNGTGMIDAFAALGVAPGQLEARIGKTAAEWTAEDIAALATIGKAIKAGDSTVAEAFGTDQRGTA